MDGPRVLARRGDIITGGIEDAHPAVIVCGEFAETEAAATTLTDCQWVCSVITSADPARRYNPYKLPMASFGNLLRRGKLVGWLGSSRVAALSPGVSTLAGPDGRGLTLRASTQPPIAPSDRKRIK